MVTAPGAAARRPPGPDPKLDRCPALTAVGVIAGKWKTRILWRLRDGPAGFGEMRRALGDVSPKVLSAQLGELGRDGVIEKSTVTAAGVAMSRYCFSPHGRTLIPALDALGAWGLAHEAR